MATLGERRGAGIPAFLYHVLSSMFWTTILFLLVLNSVPITSASVSTHVPPDWLKMCNVSRTASSSSSSPSSAIQSFASTIPAKPHIPPHPNTTYIDCFIPKSDRLHWKLNDLRDWAITNNINHQTAPNNRTVVYNIHATCEPNANISLPWPMKVPGLQQLYITHCLLSDRYSNYRDPINPTIPDEMKVLDIRHSSWLLSATNEILESSDDVLNITSDYECGQDTSLIILALSNVSDISSNFDISSLDLNFTLPKNISLPKEDDLPFDLSADIIRTGPVKPEDRLIKDKQKVVSDQNDFDRGLKLPKSRSNGIFDTTDGNMTEAEKDFLELLRKSSKTRTWCEFKKLKVLDESISRLTPLSYFEFLVQGADHPVLELMNYSRIGLTMLPRELSEWRRYFPKLHFLDLSNNHITEFEVRNYPSEPDTGVVTFNLQYNNFTVINLEILKSWARVDKFHVDIRNNPIDCNCDLSPFLSYIKSDSAFTGKLLRYKYVKFLKCQTPEYLAGQQLYTLDSESLPCPETEDNKAALISLGVIMVILIIIILVIIRFKFEIRILLYTRLNVRLPCDADSLRHHKTYDAFVSYSNDDDAWVHENLLKFLESPQSKNTQYSNGVSTVYNTPNNNKNNNSNNDKDRKTFRLCIHQRDFIPGKTIFDNIIDSIEASKHTIIVLSPSFMKSHWAMEELRQAYRQSLLEKAKHLIVLLLEKVPKEDMDPLISRCCKTFTYLDVNDALFKDRLIFSLTTKDKSSQRRERRVAKAKSKKAPRSPSQMEAGAFDNNAYSHYDYISHAPHNGRPAEPIRELSNMSTSSTKALTDYRH